MKYEVTVRQDYQKITFQCDDMDLDKEMFSHLMFIISNADMPASFTIAPKPMPAPPTIDDLE